MEEIALFGVRFFNDGTRDEELIACAKSNHEWKQSVDMCANLPVKDYDGFLFIDDTGRFFRYNLGKPPRRKRCRNYKQIFETLFSKEAKV